MFEYEDFNKSFQEKLVKLGEIEKKDRELKEIKLKEEIKGSISDIAKGIHLVATHLSELVSAVKLISCSLEDMKFTDAVNTHDIAALIKDLRERGVIWKL